MRPIMLAAIVAGLALSAFGQVQGSTLRAKYGPPLPRQIFMVRPGVEMAVTYGPNEIVCKAEIALGAATDEQLDAIAEEVAPASVRGKYKFKSLTMFGSPGAALVDYEFVTITHPILADETPWKRGLTITFKDKSCADVSGKP